MAEFAICVATFYEDLAERLANSATEAFVEAYAVSPEQVQIFIHEIDDENWAKGGRFSADAPHG